MEIKASGSGYNNVSFGDFNDKYSKIIEKGNAYAYKLQKMRQDDMMFRTQSQDKFEYEPWEKPSSNIMNFNEPRSAKGSLFISGSSAPICVFKEKRPAPKGYKAPLPKTKRSGATGKSNKNNVIPLQGFGCTNIR